MTTMHDFVAPQFSDDQLRHQAECLASLEAMQKNTARDEALFLKFAAGCAEVFGVDLEDVRQSPAARFHFRELSFAMAQLRDQAERRAREPR